MRFVSHLWVAILHGMYEDFMQSSLQIGVPHKVQKDSVGWAWASPLKEGDAAAANRLSNLVSTTLSSKVDFSPLHSTDVQVVKLGCEKPPTGPKSRSYRQVCCQIDLKFKDVQPPFLAHKAYSVVMYNVCTLFPAIS